MKLIFSPEWILRIGFGIVYAYSGYSHLVYPLSWTGFAPRWFADFISGFFPLQTIIQVQGGIEIIFAVGFLGWFFRRKAIRAIAGLACLEMLSILFLAGVNFVTFRDLGLLAGLFSLRLLLRENTP